MILGKTLNENSKIGVIAPASCSERNDIIRNLNVFRNLGFNISHSDIIFNNYGYLAGTDKERASDLMNMFINDNIDGIICYRGGFGSARIIPYLDLKIIKSNFKFFCGYSDITYLLNYFASNNMISFHGPMINSKFNENNQTLESLKYFMKFSAKNFCYNFSSFRIINGKNFKGKILGGNLSVFCSALGSKDIIFNKNTILLLEDVNEEIYAIDRLITQLINNNLINRCSAIIFGHITNCEKESKFNFNFEYLIETKLKKFNIPIIFTNLFGHNYPNLVFPIGSTAYFDNRKKELMILNDTLK